MVEFLSCWLKRARALKVAWLIKRGARALKAAWLIEMGARAQSERFGDFPLPSCCS
jgi:hypothetical protein